MSSRVDQAVPEHLRPDDWAALCVNVAAAGWGVDAAAAELASAVPRAQGKGYIAATMKRMVKEGPRHDQGPSKARAKNDPLWRSSARQAKVDRHDYEPMPVCEHAGTVDHAGKEHTNPSCFITFCGECGLPDTNRVHAVPG